MSTYLVRVTKIIQLIKALKYQDVSVKVETLSHHRCLSYIFS